MDKVFFGLRRRLNFRNHISRLFAALEIIPELDLAIGMLSYSELVRGFYLIV